MMCDVTVNVKFYLGILYNGLCLCLMALGASIAIRSIFAPLVFLFFMHLRRMVKVEEHLLLKHFGSSYKEYQKKVPRFYNNVGNLKFSLNFEPL